MTNTPAIWSIVSGKGGVGKTMLTMALASELARTRRVLLAISISLIRGLTGLLSDTEEYNKTVCAHSNA